MRRSVTLLVAAGLIAVPGLLAQTAKQTSGEGGRRLEITLSGIVIVDESTEGVLVVRFPDGSSFGGRADHHHAFIRFDKNDLDGPGSQGNCADGKSWRDLAINDKVSFEGIQSEGLDHSMTFYDGLPLVSEGVTKVSDVCKGARLKNVPHAVLTLTDGKLRIDRRTKGQWEFKPAQDGTRTAGIKWKLVNRIRLTARLMNDRLKVKSVGGRDLSFKATEQTLRLDFANAPNRCLSTQPSGDTEYGPDDHFRLYYELLEHDHTPHLPWGEKYVKGHTIPSGHALTEEGGGCPPLRRP